MLGVAAACGVAVGSALALLLRRERQVQLLALGLLSLALGVAFALAGALLPALGEVLLGVVAEVVLLAPSTAAPRAGERPQEWRWRLEVSLPLLGGLGAAGVLIGAGLAERSQWLDLLPSQPTLAEVGRQLLLGSGVALLILCVLTAATFVGGATLVQQDAREAAETQMEQARRRRLAAQRQRQAQRAAARAARRRGGT